MPAGSDVYAQLWVQFPVAAALVGVAAYAYYQIKESSRVNNERLDRERADATARIDKSHAAELSALRDAMRQQLAAKDAEIARLTGALADGLREVAKKVDKLSAKITG